MDPKMAQILAAVGGGVAFAAFVYWIIWQKKRIRVAFETFVQRHPGLEHQHASFPTALGDTDGRFFSIGARVHRTPLGRPQLQQVPDFWVQTQVLGAVPAGLLAGKRGALQGAGPVQTGNAEVDKKVFIECPDVDAAKSYLTAARQQGLLDMIALGAVLLGPTEDRIAMVARQTRGYTPKLEWLEARYAEFTKVARALDA